MVHANVSTFVKVIQKKLWPLSSGQDNMTLVWYWY